MKLAPSSPRIVIAACALVLGLTAPAPAPAAAATVLVGVDRDSVDSPRLTSDGAVWLSTRPDSAESLQTRLLRGRPGRPAAAVAMVGGHETYDGFYGSGTSVFQLTVSGELIAYSARGYDIAKSKFEGNGTTASNAYVINLPTGARTQVQACAGGADGADSALAHPWLVVAGCFVDTTTAITGATIEARDLSRPGAAPIRLAERGRDVRIAGTKVGWRAPDAYVVYDLTTRAEILRVAAAALGGIAHTWDLQADGKLAVAVGTPLDASLGTKVVWAAPADPQPKVVVVGGRFRGLRLVGDRFAFERVGDRHQVVVRPLQGAERVVAGYAPASRPGFTGFDATLYADGGFDFDGTRVAWARAQCAINQIAVRGADDPGSDDHGFALCALTLDPGAAVDRRGRLAVGVTCPALSPRVRGDACRISAALRLKGRRIATVRRRIRAGTGATLRFGRQPRLLRTRPRQLAIRATNVMRGGTAVTRATITATYPARARR